MYSHPAIQSFEMQQQEMYGIFHLLELQDPVQHLVVLVVHEEGIVATRVPRVAGVEPKINAEDLCVGRRCR
jgi:hypothetical protein